MMIKRLYLTRLPIAKLFLSYILNIKIKNRRLLKNFSIEVRRIIAEAGNYDGDADEEVGLQPKIQRFIRSLD